MRTVPSRAVLLACICVLSAGSACSAADRTVPLDDLSAPGGWQAYAWNSAPLSVQVVADAPADLPTELAGVAVAEASVNWPMDDEFRFSSLESVHGRGPIPFRLSEAGLWVWSAGDGHHLELHFGDADGEDVKVGLGSLTWEGWKYVTVPIPAEFKQPLTVRTLTWHSWGLKGAGGPARTLVGGLVGVVDDSDRVVEGDLPVQLVVASRNPHAIADDDGTCALAFRVLSWETEARAMELAARVMDTEGELVGEASETGEASGLWTGELVLDLPRNGSFPCEVTLTSGGQTLETVSCPLARLPVQPVLTDEERLRSSMGVNTHFGAPWYAFGRMGIHWARDYSWGWLGRGETAPIGQGRDYDAVRTEAEANGVIVLPITMGSFRREDESGFLDDPTEIAAGFERLARAFPSIPYWEIDNEFEYHLRDRGGLDLANYRRALTAASEGLARADGAKLVLNGTAGILDEQAAALLSSDAADAFAVVNSHYYVGTSPPELGVSDTNVGGSERYTPLTALDQLKRISRIAHAGGKESWLTETGWDVTYGPAVGELNQALYLPRNHMLAQAMGTDKVFWFYDRDIPDSTGKFGSSGLIRLDGSIRPSGVAMAALSAQTARAEMMGTLDLGDDDLYAVAFKQPEGRWTVAAWSVRADHPLPEHLRGMDALDLFGNATEPEAITPSVIYFTADALSAALEGQLRARLLSTSVLTTAPGAALDVEVAGDESVTVEWSDLPEGFDGGAWANRDGVWSASLTCAPDAASGQCAARLRAHGEGWERSSHLTLVVGPPLTVHGAPYSPGQPEIWTVTSTQAETDVTVELLGGPGVVAPTAFHVRPGVPQRVAVVPDAGANGTLTLHLTLANGVVQDVPVRPAVLTLVGASAPRLDGDLADWPSEAALPTDLLSTAGVPAEAQLHLAYTEDGLIVGARIPVNDPVLGQPQSFWDCSSLELLVDVDGGAGAWSGSCTQVWMVPVRDGDAWKLAVGRWDRAGGAGAVPDDRCQGAVAADPGGFTFEALIPYEVLGGTPANEPWRIGVAFQGVGAGEQSAWAWPRLKGDGLTDGPGQWGEVRFER